MTIPHHVKLSGLALLVMVLNVVATVLYMVVYSYVIDPGHDADYYEAHVQIAAPYCSIVAGIPLMFAAGWWGARGGSKNEALRSAMVIWFVYAIIDVSILFASGINGRIAIFFVISFLTKLAAVLGGALIASRHNPNISQT